MKTYSSQKGIRGQAPIVTLCALALGLTVTLGALYVRDRTYWREYRKEHPLLYEQVAPVTEQSEATINMPDISDKFAVQGPLLE
jgi:hypothetical protein